MIPHVPKPKKTPQWVDTIFGIKGKDDVVPHTTSSGQPMLDVTETMKSFTKTDDIKPIVKQSTLNDPFFGSFYPKEKPVLTKNPMGEKIFDPKKYKVDYEEAFSSGMKDIDLDYPRYEGWAKSEGFSPMSKDDFWETYYSTPQQKDLKKWLASRKKEQPKKTVHFTESAIDSQLAQPGWFPEHTMKKDFTGYKILAQQARGLSHKDPDFLKKLQNKDPEIMDNLQSALNNWYKDYDLLVDRRKQITDPNSKFGKQLRKIAEKFYPNASPRVLQTKLVDFSHIFPMKETANITKKSKFLDLGGSPEVTYLSPSYANQHIQRSLEAQIKLNLDYPSAKSEKEIIRLSKLLDKAKSLSYITTKGEGGGTFKTTKFGYTAEETFGKHGAPRFTDNELEELFEYLIKAEEVTPAERVAAGVPSGEASRLSKFSGVLFNEGGQVRKNMAYGGDMAQFTEMESVVPELNPAEAGMEDLVQMAQLKIPKFKNPFKPRPKPDIMSDVSSGLKITDETKGAAKVEGTVKTEGQAPIFHLKSDMEIANAVQDKMTPQQWNGYLLKKGVSQTEMHEFGLGNLLKNIGGWDESTKKWKNNVPITKSDLIEQYKNSKPIISYKIQQIEPFEKGWKDFQSFLTGQKSGGRGYLGDLPSSVREFEEVRQLRNKPQDLTGDYLRSSILKFAKEISDRTGRDIKGAWPELEPQITATINRIIKERYGIENVIENGFGNVKVPFYTQNLVNRFSRLKKGEGFYMGKSGVGHEGSQFLEGGTGYIEIPFTYNPNPKGARANEPQFKFGEGHFTNPKGNNPVFWLRASERVDERGKRVFLIEEIQSDMHQKPKQKPDTFTYAQRHDEPEFINKTFSLNQVKKLKGDLVKVSDQIDKITGHTDPSAVTIMERLKVKREALRNQIREAEDLIAQAAGKSDEVFPEGPWKKSENQVKVAIKTLINLATQEGFDSVAIITGKAKNYAVSADEAIAKGNRGFYDGIAPSAMKNVAKNLKLEFSSTNIKDGKGNTWAKIPIINLKKEPVTTSVDMYKAEGGYIYRPSFVDVVPVL
jgi:hypothetical protein